MTGEDLTKDLEEQPRTLQEKKGVAEEKKMRESKQSSNRQEAKHSSWGFVFPLMQTCDFKCKCVIEYENYHWADFKKSSMSPVDGTVVRIGTA